MTLQELASFLDAQNVSTSDDLNSIIVNNAYACDLMSDVLAFCTPGSLLLTGLTNVQIVRTAQMLDIPAIVFVRGKRPLEETIQLARENGIPILLTRYSMFESCRRVAIITYEAEINLVIHAGGGMLKAEIYEDHVVLIAEDQGPGIADISKAMTEGYTTASDQAREMGFGAGMGLPNIKRNSDVFNIESEVGVGTTLTCTVYFNKK